MKMACRWKASTCLSSNHKSASWRCFVWQGARACWCVESCAQDSLSSRFFNVGLATSTHIICNYIYIVAHNHTHRHTYIHTHTHIHTYIYIIYMYVRMGTRLQHNICSHVYSLYLSTAKGSQLPPLWLKYYCRFPEKISVIAEAVSLLSSWLRANHFNTNKEHISERISDSQVISRRSPTEPTSG